ncbi:2'-deoxynucleoside 5'-phosphate N-hydrolase 1-like isoform X1 [Tigriopus californicus]|uniref:2'-deoxynucleoside 5'-phosphate N-hydrolase 1-like isoform X1 n=1 Tax=Tigriopus californicus TaxID=6832 RepID=UPI0027DA636F|nr:2'-deoxynucleoside 5'-phosphate N-hydrolase 1-like isoform X1 [Tigriopus californicus]
MSLAIYFCGSIRAGRQDVDLYGRLTDKLSKFGRILTPFVADPLVTGMSGEHEENDRQIYDRDMELLDECDVVVAEVTVPSLGVGFEIGSAVAMGKRILCLYRPQPGKKLSAMILGMPESHGTVVEYAEDGIDAIFEEFFKK